jgi:hypothetical protein
MCATNGFPLAARGGLSRAVAFSWLAITFLVSWPSAAQDVAGAEALFSKGVSEMTAERFDVACPMLVESHRLDPRPGTIFTIAECHAKAGKVATAVAYYEDYLRAAGALPAPAQAKHATRIVVAQTQLAALRPSVPTLTLSLASPQPASVHLRRDTSDLTAASLGLALPVDPGEHVVVVDVPGHKPAEQRFTIEPGQNAVIDLTPLVASVTGDGAPTSTAAPVLAKDIGVSSFDNPPRERKRARRIAAYSVGGLAVASLVLGGVAGGIALSDKSVVNSQCPRQTCSVTGMQAVNDGKTWSAVSTVGLAVGGAALTGGLVLYFTSSVSAKNPAQTGGIRATNLEGSLAASPGGASLTLKGLF